MFSRTFSRLGVVVVVLGLLLACGDETAQPAAGDGGNAGNAGAGTAAPAAGAATRAPAQPTATRIPTPIPTPLPTIPSIGQVLQGTVEGAHYLGRADAPVTITMYSDFLCRECAEYVLQTEPQIIQNFVATGRAKLVYYHAVANGNLSARLSEAAECTGNFGKFWEMRYGIYQRQPVLFASDNVDAALGRIATNEIGANQAEFDLCMEEREHLTEILAQANEARREGGAGLPIFDINGTKIEGARPYDEFARAIEAAQP